MLGRIVAHVAEAVRWTTGTRDSPSVGLVTPPVHRPPADFLALEFRILERLDFHFLSPVGRVWIAVGRLGHFRNVTPHDPHAVVADLARHPHAFGRIARPAV